MKGLLRTLIPYVTIFRRVALAKVALAVTMTRLYKKYYCS